jgi:signal transduction histidine kinase
MAEDYVKLRTFIFDRSGIHVAISGAGITVRANRPRLIQVLDNLVQNSIYWLNRGEVTGEVVGQKQIAVELTSSGFVISDSGPGVDSHYEESLFEMFVTAKPERDSGQGLGLFIARELLQIDGCEIELLSDRNEAGRKYRFAVSLQPLAV